MKLLKKKFKAKEVPPTSTNYNYYPKLQKKKSVKKEFKFVKNLYDK